MSPKQKKLAAKAPPPNKLDEKDFKVLREEKAKGRGMGLQDEKVQPGKVMKAKRGKLFQGYLGTFDASAEASTPKAQRGVTTIVGVRPGAKIGKGKKKFKSMEAMRKAKGFKPGESASEFNKRRLKLAGAKKALASTRIGKIVLPIAAAGVAAQQYLKGKMKKDKKMGGGMMQKPMGYSKGGGYDSGIPGKLRDYSSKFNKDGFTFKNPRVKGPDQSPRLKKLIKRREALDTAKRVASTVASVASPVTAAASAAYKLAKKMKDKDRLTDRDIDKAKSLNNRMGSKNRPIKKDNSSRNPNPKTPTMMGGGMMQKPMGYKHGTKPGAGPLGGLGRAAGRPASRSQQQKKKKEIDLILLRPVKEGPANRNTTIKEFRVKGNMGGGMMQKPMGYSKGVSVKARGCKLGRTRPTKIT
jgi:hypothetical protein